MPGDDDEPETRFDGDEEISFYDYILKHKGDLDDEEGYTDAYYGFAKWGSEEVAGATPDHLSMLVVLGIAREA